MGTRSAALVVGASRGIGLAVASALAREGWDLTMTARGDSALTRAAGTIASAVGDLQTVAADIGTSSGIGETVRLHTERFGRTDCVVLCAGTGTVGAWEDYPLSRFDRQFAINVRAPFELIQRLLPSLRHTATGIAPRAARVVCLASIAGVAAAPRMSAYGASKAALIALCDALNTEEAVNGVCATAISPGYVDTEMTAWVRDRLAPEDMIRDTDIAELVLAITRISRQVVIPSVVMTRPGPVLWRA